MARRIDYDGPDPYDFESNDPAPTNNDPDMSTPNYFDGSDVVQPVYDPVAAAAAETTDPWVPPADPAPAPDTPAPDPVWKPGGDANTPPTAKAATPQTIAPALFTPAAGLDVSPDATAPGTFKPLPTTGPIPTTKTGAQVGSGNPWVTGSSAPTTAPDGYHWDPLYAMFMPNTPSTTTTTTTSPIPATGRTSDQTAILAQIAQWAGMPGADPSLASDPMYWFTRITQTGGLGQDNLQFWQDASVGPNAYFRNPNREKAAPTSVAGTTGSTANPGASVTSGDFTSLLAQLSSMFGPNSTPSSVAAPNGPGASLTDGLNQVGQTPFDQTMDASLEDLLTHGGASPYGRTIEATLNDLISRGGLTPNTSAQLIQARGANASAMQSQTADARAALAARGLASPHGGGQGAETTAIGRITQGLAPTYASAVTDINNHAIDVANSSVMSALTMATGMSEADATTILNTVGTGTARQTALANIALKTLEDNMQWDEFLANFGLQKDQVEEQLQQGRIAALTPLLNLFLLMSGQASQGYIGAN